MRLQLNVHRLVVVYRVPALDALDAATLAVRLERWRLGAEHAGWKFGWRDTASTGPGSRNYNYIETYCYAFAGTDFLEDEQQPLLANRHCRDDALLHDRGSPMRHPPVATPRGTPGIVGGVLVSMWRGRSVSLAKNAPTGWLAALLIKVESTSFPFGRPKFWSSGELGRPSALRPSCRDTAVSVSSPKIIDRAARLSCGFL